MKAIHLLEKTPIAAAGLAFGIASLGWAWQTNFSGNNYLQWSCALIAALLSILVIAKLIHRPHLLFQSLQHPVTGSVLPTVAMSWVIISQSFITWSELAAISIWGFALTIHVIVFIIFCYHRIKSFNFNDMLPAWFIPPIGLAVAAMANPSIATTEISRSLVYFAILCCFIMLPVMAYRLLKGSELLAANKPTLALFAAPPNLSLACYLKYWVEPSLPFVIVLLTLSISLTLFAYICFVRLFSRSFTPVSAAFTFPCIIGASAMFASAEYFALLDFAATTVFFQQLALIQLCIASVITLLVGLRYAKYFYSPI